MQPGLELDYSLGGVLWIPARVECLVKEENVCIRFAIGWGQEVLHVLDPLSLSRLVAPAGTYTIPLLAGQPVDFLRRMPAAQSFPACEQWLAGEVEGYPDSGLDCTTRSPLSVRITSLGRSVLGVSYGPDALDAGAAGSGGSGGSSSSTLVTLSQGAICPHGLFSKRVPTAADIRSQGPLPLPEPQALLPERCAASFRESADVEALLHLGGRRCLRDFDVVDILPPPRRKGLSGERGAYLERLLMELAVGGELRGGVQQGGQLLRRGSEEGGAGYYKGTSKLHKTVICPLASPPPTVGEGAFPSPYRGCAFKRPRRGLFYPSRGASGSSAEPSGAGGSSGAASGGLALGAHASCHYWVPARVRFLTRAEAASVASELTRRTLSRASFSARGMSFADANGWDVGELGGEAGAGDGGGSGSGSGAKSLYAFWYEFAPKGDPAMAGTGSITSVLRFAPLIHLTAVAPLGTHTWPFIPGMRVDARRLGGKWAVATVVSSNRYFLTLRVPRPLNDSNAGDPRAVAGLPDLRPSVRVDGQRAPARVGGAGADTLRVSLAAAAAAPALEGGDSADAQASIGAGEAGAGFPILLSGAAEEGCEVIPAQLWRHLVGRVGVHTKAAVDDASAKLLPSLLKERGMEKWLVGLQAPR